MLRDASQQADTGAAAVATGAYQPGKLDVLSPGDDTQQQQNSATAAAPAEPAEAQMSYTPVDPGQALEPNRFDDAVLQPTLPVVPASC